MRLGYTHRHFALCYRLSRSSRLRIRSSISPMQRSHKLFLAERRKYTKLYLFLHWVHISGVSLILTSELKWIHFARAIGNASISMTLRGTFRKTKNMDQKISTRSNFPSLSNSPFRRCAFPLHTLYETLQSLFLRALRRQRLDIGPISISQFVTLPLRSLLQH